jgi:hypothetical protein
MVGSRAYDKRLLGTYWIPEFRCDISFVFWVVIRFSRRTWTIQIISGEKWISAVRFAFSPVGSSKGCSFHYTPQQRASRLLWTMRPFACDRSSTSMTSR